MKNEENQLFECLFEKLIEVEGKIMEIFPNILSHKTSKRFDYEKFNELIFNDKDLELCILRDSYLNIHHKIICTFAPTLLAIARKLMTGTWIDDGVSIGNIALFEAVDRFDPNKMVPFKPFAIMLLKQRINAQCKKPGGSFDRRYQLFLEDPESSELPDIQDPTPACYDCDKFVSTTPAGINKLHFFVA